MPSPPTGADTVSDFEQAVALADVRLFDAIPAELTRNDRVSLLRCQHALRTSIPSYVYLEIGSHLGGSIQPHLLDPNCSAVISIDPRPLVQDDARGVRFGYPKNSTQAMLARLRAIGADHVSKVRTIELVTRDLDPDNIGATPHLCFIDGEHTDGAARGDYLFCARACKSNGIVVFHDAPVVYNGLAAIIDELKSAGANFRAYHLPDTIFVIELGSATMLDDAAVAALVRDNHVGYLMALRLNDGYRRYANLWPMRMLRHAASKVGLRRWAERYDYGIPPQEDRGA